MTKFKVGDIVVGNQDNELKGVEQGQLYEVVATEAVGAYDYIMTDLSLGCWVLSERFDLYKAAPYQEEQDDPLPPAPESVVYFNSVRDEGNDQCLTVDFDDNPIYAGTLCVSVHPRGDYENYYSVSFDPDAALQLAHDLTRMAMEIKRKEKQNA